MTQEDYISFETAKLLKEKGFDEKCRTYYKVFPESRIAAIYHSSENRGVSEDDPNEILCPTLQMVMKWLREVHKIHISVEIGFDVDNHQYYFFVPSVCRFSDKSGEYENPFGEKEFDTYEKACEAAIKYCLENLI